jgi:aspartate/methionine/tyrosine aminotransferase
MDIITYQFEVTALFIVFFLLFTEGYSPLRKYQFVSEKKSSIMASDRAVNTELPYIEEVLDKYSSLPNLTMLALGSSYWSPPNIALETVVPMLNQRQTHRYNNILGFPPLKESLIQLLQAQSIDMTGMDLTISAGANQGFTNLALCLLDSKDKVIIFAPYYFSHLLAVQLCQAEPIICQFNRNTLEPDWEVLSELIREHQPKMVSDYILSIFLSLHHILFQLDYCHITK